MSTLEPIYTAWPHPTSTTIPVAEDYIGRHRKPEARRFGLLRMFYFGRHRRR